MGDPLGAPVFVDDALIGVTPVLQHPLPTGRHRVRLVGSAGEITRTIQVGSGAHARYRWSGGETWEAF